MSGSFGYFPESSASASPASRFFPSAKYFLPRSHCGSRSEGAPAPYATGTPSHKIPKRAAARETRILLPHLFRDFVLPAFVGKLVVAKGLPQADPGEEEDQKKHPDNRDVVGLGNDQIGRAHV